MQQVMELMPYFHGYPDSIFYHVRLLGSISTLIIELSLETTSAGLTLHLLNLKL